MKENNKENTHKMKKGVTYAAPCITNAIAKTRKNCLLRLYAYRAITNNTFGIYGRL